MDGLPSIEGPKAKELATPDEVEGEVLLRRRRRRRRRSQADQHIRATFLIIIWPQSIICGCLSDSYLRLSFTPPTSPVVVQPALS